MPLSDEYPSTDKGLLRQELARKFITDYVAVLALTGDLSSNRLSEIYDQFLRENIPESSDIQVDVGMFWIAAMDLGFVNLAEALDPWIDEMEKNELDNDDPE